VIGGVLGIMIGFLFWVTKYDLYGYTVIWCIVFLVFVAVFVILMFVCGKNRNREEKILIQMAQRKQDE
jgi:hypothetical protein